MRDLMWDVDACNASMDEFSLQLANAQSKLFGFLFKRLADREQALDVLQETNLVLLQKKASFVPGTDFLAWSTTVAHFQMLAFRKRALRDRLVFDDAVIEAMEREQGPAENSELAEQRASAMRECMRKLNQRQKFLIEMRYGQTKRVDEIADGLGRTANAVCLQLHRIRQALLKCVEARLKGATS